jgi:hypothetical protein
MSRTSSPTPKSCIWFRLSRLLERASLLSVRLLLTSVRVVNLLGPKRPGDGRFQITDDELRIKLYRGAMLDIRDSFRFDRNIYGNMSCFLALTTRFIVLGQRFPAYDLRNPYL